MVFRDIEAIAEAIQRDAKPHGPVVIGIEGFGGAGKSTFAMRLSDALKDAYVVSIDDFIVKERFVEPSWNTGMFDRQRLEQQVLRPATSNQTVSYQRLIWHQNVLSAPEPIPPVRYLIVEGITAYHPDIAHYYDYKIWVDTPMETAAQRGRARDGSGVNAAYWDVWVQNDLDYCDQYHPERQADFIFDNSGRDTK